MFYGALLIILFSIYREKSNKLRGIILFSILYVIIFDLWDLYKPITSLLFQFLWILALIFSIIGVILSIKNNKYK